MRSTFVFTMDLSYFAANYSRKIASNLGQVGNASWLVTGYLITESASQPMYAHLALYKGHKVSLVVAATSMTVGLLLCSFSQTLWQLALSRAVVGLGAAGLELLILIIINDQVDLYSLPLWKSITTAVSTLASFLGPSAGAAITDSFGFRVVFGLEFVVMIAATVGIVFTLGEIQSDHERKARPRARMDYVGAGLLLLVVAVPLLILDLGEKILAWTHPVMISLYAILPALIFLFLRSQIGSRGQTLIPLRFLRSKSVVAVFACGLPAWLSWDQLKYRLGQYVEARSLRLLSTSTFSDWALSCIFLGIPLGSFLSGIIIRRYYALRPLLRVVSVLNLLTYLFFAAGWIQPENLAVAPFLILVGLNVGMLDSCWLISIFSQAVPQDQPALYAFFDLGRANTGNFGIAVALASTNAMIRSNLRSSLIHYPNKEEIIHKSLESFDAIRQLPPNIQSIVLDAFISSSEKAFAISCYVLIISVIAAFYVPEVELVREDDRID
ncbi:major facilitator superfamily domain-containing protein [Nemania diffusa]|nr:major facilitator superfamily domain-containing protein [Nemania diffusa]